LNVYIYIRIRIIIIWHFGAAQKQQKPRRHRSHDRAKVAPQSRVVGYSRQSLPSSPAPQTHLTHTSIPKTHSALRTGTLLIIIITPAHAACHPLGKVTVFVMITNQEFPASALISSRHHNLRLSASVPDLVGSPLEISMDNVLTIEELRQHMGSCFTCGVSWTDDHVSLDCSECGGYSLERPCPLCDGQCGVQWKRDFAMVS